jgi:hypothetical protein
MLHTPPDACLICMVQSATDTHAAAPERTKASTANMNIFVSMAQKNFGGLAGPDDAFFFKKKCNQTESATVWQTEEA